MPMPSDFAVRLAGGLAFVLLLTSRKDVPPAFFRTVALVAMGLLVVGCLAAIGASPTWMMGLLIASAVMAYLASAFWGLGLPSVAFPATVSVALACAGIMAWPPLGIRGLHFTGIDGFNAASRLASSGLLGSTLAAMLLGHHYLTAPAMSISPLKRYVAAMACSLVARVALAEIGLWIAWNRGDRVSPLFLAMRWGMGVVGPGLATYMTRETVKIRSTQSATGILYIAITLVLFGELAGMILGRGVGIEL